jgi:hypothetical protein
MSDETLNNETYNPAGEAATGPATDRVGFCQDCGTPLTPETIRSVGAGVFCEPCLTARVAAAPPAAGFVPPAPGDAHPVLAGFLGIIPGVGAMYNGQYAKGVFHLVVFVVLSSLGSHVNDIFKLFCFFWFCYQIIDAYQTAKARQEGRPLPNPFGFNEIGERMGFGRGWTYSGTGWTSTPNAATPNATAPNSAGSSAPVPPAAYPYTAPVSSGPGWVGYVPPTNFAAAPVPPPPSAAQAGAAWGQAPYAQTYAPTYGDVTSTPYAPPVVPVTPARRFPVGALWLVGLGVVFLLAEFAPEWGLDWSLSGRWLLPLLFAGLAIWSATRRISLGVRSVRAFRGSIILMTLALLFAFQAADFAGLQRTWPVFLIVLGVLLIAERTALNTIGFAAAATPSSSFVPTETEAEAAAARTRAAWSAPAPAAPQHTTGIETTQAESGENDIPKGGF